MGMDPLTIGLGMAAVGKGLDMYGQMRGQGAANRKQQYVQDQAMGMMQNGPSSWEQAIQRMIGGRAAPGQIDPTSGNIDMSSILSGANPGNDALMQFLRSDPSRQLNAGTTASLTGMMNNPTMFDSSKAYGMMQDQDARTIQNAMTSLTGSFGGLGQRFGTAAMRQAGDLQANIAGQFGARNAGIAQSSFADAQARAMQAAGLLSGREQFGATQSLNAANMLNQQGLGVAQLAAGMAGQNQNNLFRNQQFNQQNLNDFFAQQMGGLQAGYGMMQGRNQYNQGLLGIIQGLPQQQSGYSALGGGMGDIGQLIAMLPMLRKMGGTA
jgi:hypothetical protein